jgi:glycosyltransferase involved in cell wall biosynthesis
MRVLMLSTFDQVGGAALATYRLHKGFQRAAVDSIVLVQVKHTDDHSVKCVAENLITIRDLAAARLDLLPLSIYRNRSDTYWSLGWRSKNIQARVRRENPDLVHLNWVGRGFVPTGALPDFGCPIIWTLHDTWPFTGGCHYPQDCRRYEHKCGVCPQLGSTSEWDVSRWVWRRKARFWRGLDLSLVTPSRWLARCAESSSLFGRSPIQVIPNGLDIEVFKPIDRPFARKILNVPCQGQLILAGGIRGTDDRRKGISYLQPALQEMSRNGWMKKAALLVFGASRPAHPPEMGLESRYLGFMHDETSMVLAYSAADVFVAPSIQDNLPNTVMEAMACGVPCVAFDIGGMADMIEHRRNGYLARPFDRDDLARGIVWVLEDKERHQELSRQARWKVERDFDMFKVTSRYVDLFKQVLAHHK